MGEAQTEPAAPARPPPAAADLDDAAAEAVKGIGIPPCPMILTGVIREMRAEEPNFRRIGALVSTDVGLAATTIKTANSAFFALPKPAATVQEALACMGVRTVAQVLTGLLLRQAFAASEGEAMSQFWKRSAQRANLTAKLAHALRAADVGAAYNFGLFRDCGKAIMLRKYDGYAAQMLDDPTDGLLLTTLENERFGLDHARIGHHLARSWHLPKLLCDAILCHHEAAAMRGTRPGIEVASMRLVALAALADHFDVGRGNELAGETVLAGAQLGVSPERLDEIAEEMNLESA